MHNICSLKRFTLNKALRTLLLSLLLLMLLSLRGLAQTDTILVKAKVIGKDTIPVIILSEVPLKPPVLVEPADAKRFARLVANIKRVYPYAKLAGLRFKELEITMATTPKRKDRKEAIKAVEAEIKDKYGDELKNLSISQGKILIKLLDRQTGNSSYDIIQDFKGSMMAFFFQGFARFWGYNLKTKYDPKGEDKEIEMIVQMIERGEI